MVRALAVLLAVGLGSALAEAARAGCPGYWELANPQTMAAFDFERFISPGYWYEMFSHNIPVVTTGCQCTRYHQTPRGDGTYNDVFTCRKGSPGNPHVTMFNSTLQPNHNTTEAGKMKETLGPESPATQYWVLDITTDYKEALLYGCADPDGHAAEFVYFFSTAPSFPEDLHARWTQYLVSKGVSIKDVIQIDQTGCWNNTHH